MKEIGVRTGPEQRLWSAGGCYQVYIRNIPPFYPFVIASLA